MLICLCYLLLSQSILLGVDSTVRESIADLVNEQRKFFEAENSAHGKGSKTPKQQPIIIPSSPSGFRGGASASSGRAQGQSQSGIGFGVNHSDLLDSHSDTTEVEGYMGSGSGNANSNGGVAWGAGHKTNQSHPSQHGASYSPMVSSSMSVSSVTSVLAVFDIASSLPEDEMAVLIDLLQRRHKAAQQHATSSLTSRNSAQQQTHGYIPSQTHSHYQYHVRSKSGPAVLLSRAGGEDTEHDQTQDREKEVEVSFDDLDEFDSGIQRQTGLVSGNAAEEHVDEEVVQHLTDNKYFLIPPVTNTVASAHYYNSSNAKQPGGPYNRAGSRASNPCGTTSSCGSASTTPSVVPIQMSTAPKPRSTNASSPVTALVQPKVARSVSANDAIAPSGNNNGKKHHATRGRSVKNYFDDLSVGSSNSSLSAFTARSAQGSSSNNNVHQTAAVL